MTNHLGKNKIIAPKVLSSSPCGFAARARIITYGAIVLFLPSWLVTNSILPMLETSFFCCSFSVFHLSDFVIRPKYKILMILYCGQTWQMTNGKVKTRFIIQLSVFHHWNKRNVIESKTGQITARPNFGWLPSKLESQKGLYFLYSAMIQTGYWYQ